VLRGYDDTYYAELEVAINATRQQIRASYKRLVIQWHPDKRPDATASDRKAADLRLRGIREAYAVLGDPEERAGYDREKLPSLMRLHKKQRKKKKKSKDAAGPADPLEAFAAEQQQKKARKNRGSSGGSRAAQESPAVTRARRRTAKQNKQFDHVWGCMYRRQMERLEGRY